MTLLCGDVLAAVLGTSAPPPPPPDPDPFDDPGTPTPGFLAAANTYSSNTTNSVTAVVGGRIVILFTQQRGSDGTPLAPRTLVDIVGTGDFAGLSLNGGQITLAAVHTQILTGTPAGVRASIATLVVPEGYDGTGAFTISWNAATWTSLAQAWALPACSVVDVWAGGAVEANTTLPLSTAEELQAEDMAFSVCVQSVGNSFTVPTGFTSAANSSQSNDRHRTAWRNGGVASPITWTGLYNGRPKAAAAIVLRRT